MVKIIIFLILLSTTNAIAEVPPKNFGYKFCNHHKFTYLLLKVYDVYLCSNNKQTLDPDEVFKTDFSLIINYNMNFDKEDLSKSSMKEINRYYDVSKEDQDHYYQQLMSIFPNVRQNDIIEARYNKRGFISFYHNKIITGKINDATFSKLFLDIWLHKDNKYKKMTQDLFKKNE